jgi:predicted transcriptional regulator
MDTTTIKVSKETRERIKALGAAQRQSADAVVQAALDELDRRIFWDQFDAAVAVHGVDDLRAESELYAGTLKDGLDD